MERLDRRIRRGKPSLRASITLRIKLNFRPQVPSPVWLVNLATGLQERCGSRRSWHGGGYIFKLGGGAIRIRSYTDKGVHPSFPQ